MANSTEDDPTLELHFIKQLGCHGSRQLVHDLLCSDIEVMMDKITDVVWEGIEALGTLKEDDGEEGRQSPGSTGNEKFSMQAQQLLTFGGMSTFFSGLESIIGAPKSNVNGAIKEEHNEMSGMA